MCQPEHVTVYDVVRTPSRSRMIYITFNNHGVDLREIFVHEDRSRRHSSPTIVKCRRGKRSVDGNRFTLVRTRPSRREMWVGDWSRLLNHCTSPHFPSEGREFPRWLRHHVKYGVLEGYPCPTSTRRSLCCKNETEKGYWIGLRE